MSKRWSQADDDALRQFYPKHGPHGVQRVLPLRSASSITTRAFTLHVSRGGVAEMPTTAVRHSREFQGAVEAARQSPLAAWNQLTRQLAGQGVAR